MGEWPRPPVTVGSRPRPGHPAQPGPRPRSPGSWSPAQPARARAPAAFRWHSLRAAAPSSGQEALRTERRASCDAEDARETSSAAPLRGDGGVARRQQEEGEAERAPGALLPGRARTARITERRPGRPRAGEARSGGRRPRATRSGRRPGQGEGARGAQAPATSPGGGPSWGLRPTCGSTRRPPSRHVARSLLPPTKRRRARRGHRAAPRRRARGRPRYLRRRTRSRCTRRAGSGSSPRTPEVPWRPAGVRSACWAPGQVVPVDPGAGRSSRPSLSAERKGPTTWSNVPGKAVLQN